MKKVLTKFCPYLKWYQKCTLPNLFFRAHYQSGGLRKVTSAEVLHAWAIPVLGICFDHNSPD